MIVEIGHFALVLALIVAVVQGTLPLVGAQRRIEAWMALASWAAIAQFALIATAFLALMYAHVTSDFSVANVFENSHSLKPRRYKIAGVWGNHEGSLLLWVLILSLFGASAAWFGGGLPQTGVADLIGDVVNRYTGFWPAAPGVAQLEGQGGA